MMIKASEKRSELLLELVPYFKKNEPYNLLLIDDAPKEIKEKFKEYIKLCEKEATNPDFG